MTPTQVVETLYRDAREGRWDAVQAVMADDLVIHEPPSLPYGGEWRGHDALERLFKHVMALWADPKVEIRRFVGDQEYVVAILDFTMTSRATGERFTQPVAEISRFADGKIVEMRIHYFDTAEVARQGA